jgi:hypothetical protein
LVLLVEEVEVLATMIDVEIRLCGY